jgi:CHAT domain-containing protein
LWSVPFAALYDGQQYLTERYGLTYLPDLGAIRCDRQLAAQALLAAPLIVGCSEDGRLAYVLDEARAIAADLDHAVLLLESQATLARVREAAAEASLIHLTTHGVFRADAPLFSSLHLYDGWLTAGDLGEWRLPATELVILSACETGVSRCWGSDLLGLARGFARAGARRLVASRWAVDDAATTGWMTEFYHALRAGQGIHHSLRAAQLAAMDAHPHPFYWAGFELLALA